MVKLKDSLAPVVLFVYNRPEHTRKTVEALRANRLAPQSRLFVFSDGPKNDLARPAVEAVRQYIDSIDGFASVEVIKRLENRGLADSVIGGVSEVVKEYGRIIVLEDDLVTSPYFLNYMNEGLMLYKDDIDVASIEAFIQPLDLSPLPQSFFLPFAGSWGWATWERSWKDFEYDADFLLREIKKRGLAKSFDFDGSYPCVNMLKLQIRGKVDSWAIRWGASNFLRGKKSLYPNVAYVNNIGMDGTGVHYNRPMEDAYSDIWNQRLANSFAGLRKIPVIVDAKVYASLKRFYRGVQPPNILVRAFLKLVRVLKRKFRW